ncbi:head-tail connector protein [Cupriavidus taiwanensis]|uniref:head-tail connector protein n=1 Tax=Cupriavidus taiwanensis TaxID=164546 RepID=UPI000E18D1A5|nr:hypothetical protein [Cupriavidus taiwanensis]SPA17252.1 conserved hypothetical protein [Cupriavidus taiwanensis]
MGIVITPIPTATEPVSLELARTHCRVDKEDTGEDALFEAVYIPSGRQQVEQYTGLALLAVDVLAVMSSTAYACGCYALPLGPATELRSITYLDADGVVQNVDLVEYGASIVREGMVWAVRTTKPLPSASSYDVAYVAGDATGTCEPNLKLAMLLLIGDAYENREYQVTGTIMTTNQRAVALMDPFRVTFGV